MKIEEIESMYRRPRILSGVRNDLNALFERYDGNVGKLDEENLLTYKKILIEDLNETNEFNVMLESCEDNDSRLDKTLLEEYKFLVAQLIEVDIALNVYNVV